MQKDNLRYYATHIVSVSKSQPENLDVSVSSWPSINGSGERSLELTVIFVVHGLRWHSDVEMASLCWRFASFGGGRVEKCSGQKQNSWTLFENTRQRTKLGDKSRCPASRGHQPTNHLNPDAEEVDIEEVQEFPEDAAGCRQEYRKEYFVNIQTM